MDKKLIEINAAELKGSRFLRLRDIAIVKHYGGTIAVVIPVDGKEQAEKIIERVSQSDIETNA